MGQFGNQPDFITEVKSLTVSDTINSTTFLNGSAIYVGNSTTGTDIKVIMVGSNSCWWWNSNGYGCNNNKRCSSW